MTDRMRHLPCGQAVNSNPAVLSRYGFAGKRRIRVTVHGMKNDNDKNIKTGYDISKMCSFVGYFS